MQGAAAGRDPEGKAAEQKKERNKQIMDAKKVFKKCRFSKAALDIVETFSRMHEEAEKPEVYEERLVEAVIMIPKSSYEVEAADNISFAGILLSWIRDWKNGEIHIMTLEEAKALDAEYSRTGKTERVSIDVQEEPEK